jgi:sugar porter (SP) family MFS transporter
MPVTNTIRLSDQINKPYLALLTTVAALGGLLFGFDIAIITGAGPFIEMHFHLENSQLGLGFSFASLLFGCMFGAAFVGKITDLYGRRKILFFVAILFLLTSLMTGMADSFAMFVFARFVGGLSVGAASMLSPMYVAEVAPARMRGALVSFYQLSIVFGILVSYLINYLLRDLGENNWRWMFFTGVAPSALFFILLFFVPETPRFLFRMGQHEKSYGILKKIGGETMANAEIAEIRESLKETKGRFRDLLNKEHRTMTLVGMALAILVQITGINAVVDYAPKIFITAGFHMDAALFGTFGLGVTNVVCTFVSISLIDKVGRRTLYIVGSAGMTATLFILAGMSYADHFKGMFVLLACVVYLAFFMSCIGPAFWTLVSEIYPNKMRGNAMIVPVVVQWFFNALMVWVFPEMLRRFQTGTFVLIGVMALVQLAFSIKWLPETKGKSLEEIEAMWSQRH